MVGTIGNFGLVGTERHLGIQRMERNAWRSCCIWRFRILRVVWLVWMVRRERNLRI